MNSEVDVNVLVSIYNQKISALTNQNILLEAKLQTLQKDYQEEKNSLLMKIVELGKDPQPKSRKKADDYQQSGVE
jgi:hypothetical protein